MPQFRSDAITGDSVEVIDINGDGLLDLHFTHNQVNFNNQGRLEELFYVNIGSGSFQKLSELHSDVIVSETIIQGSVSQQWLRAGDVNSD